jgi:DNA-binding Lrp family transcriptional regulator
MTKLLRLLEEDCTLTTSNMASMAAMPVEEVKAAIKKYEDEKVILGYKAIVDWDRTEREAVTALIEVRVTPQRAKALTALPSGSINMRKWRASISCPAPSTSPSSFRAVP